MPGATVCKELDGKRTPPRQDPQPASELTLCFSLLWFQFHEDFLGPRLEIDVGQGQCMCPKPDRWLPPHSFLSVPEHSPPFTEEACGEHLLCAWKWNAEMKEAQRLNTEVHIALGLDKKANTVQQEGCDNRDKIKAERCPVEPQRRNCSSLRTERQRWFSGRREELALFKDG